MRPTTVHEVQPIGSLSLSPSGWFMSARLHYLSNWPWMKRKRGFSLSGIYVAFQGYLILFLSLPLSLRVSSVGTSSGTGRTETPGDGGRRVVAEFGSTSGTTLRLVVGPRGPAGMKDSGDWRAVVFCEFRTLGIPQLRGNRWGTWVRAQVSHLPPDFSTTDSTLRRSSSTHYLTFGLITQ